MMLSTCWKRGWRTAACRPLAYVLSRAETFLPRWHCADLGLLSGIPSGCFVSPKGIDSSAQGNALGDGARSKNKVDGYDELCTRSHRLRAAARPIRMRHSVPYGWGTVFQPYGTLCPNRMERSAPTIWNALPQPYGTERSIRMERQRGRGLWFLLLSPAPPQQRELFFFTRNEEERPRKHDHGSRLR